MKTVLYIVVALIAFCGVVAGTLHFTVGLTKGNLTSVVNSFLGRVEDVEAGGEVPGETRLPQIAAALRQKEKELAERDAEITAQEKRLGQERAEFDQIRKNVENLVKQVDKQLEALDEQEEKQLQELADTYKAMDADRAAEKLQELEVERAVQILLRISSRNRAEILQNMTNAVEITEKILGNSGQTSRSESQ